MTQNYSHNIYHDIYCFRGL